MDTIDKWLKSLRLHKYTHLFQSLSYDQMLGLEENYLIERQVTKGARNKMLVSVKKLNLRHERLINLVDDLAQDNISMKEALTVLKDMLITPIPPPPYKLTHLFIGTLEKVAQRLIQSCPGMDDSACHGIMATIVDECLKHNSFTKEQKAKVASFRQYLTKEQKSKVASFRQYVTKEQKARMAGNFKQLQQQQQQQLLHQQRSSHNSLHHTLNSNNHLHLHQVSNFHSHYSQQQHNRRQLPPVSPPLHQFHHHHHHLQDHLSHLSLNQQQQQHHHHQINLNHHNSNSNSSSSVSSGHWTKEPIRPPSISASLSTIGSASNSDEEERHQTYKEYSLLGPGITFELPCLRAMVASDNFFKNGAKISE